jgi:hypothetical protein
MMVYSSVNLIAYTCKDELYVFEKPRVYMGCRYLDTHTCSLVLSTFKFIKYSLSYLFFIIIRNYMVILASLLYTLATVVFNKYIKKCSLCSDLYLIRHVCQPRYTVNIKNLYTVMILILHVLAYKAEGGLAHSVINTDSGSLITVKDTPGLIQEFKYREHTISIIIRASYIKFKISKLHDVLSIHEVTIEEQNVCCVPNIRDCKLHSGRAPDHVFEKTRDNFGCILHQAKVAFICKNEYITEGSVYKALHSELVITYDSLLDGRQNDNVVNLDMRNKGHESDHLVFITNDGEIYEGNICITPEYSCWGKNIMKDGELIQLKNVKVHDEVGMSYTVMDCGVPDRTANEVLHKPTGSSTISNIYIKDHNCGHIYFNINETVLPLEDTCNGELDYTISVQGCYQCEQGFKVSINHKCSKCCTLDCNIDGSSAQFILNGLGTTHKYFASVNPTIIINCGSGDRVFKLEEFKIEARVIPEYRHVVEPIKAFDSINLDFSIDNLKKMFMLFAISILIMPLLIITIKSIHIFKLLTQDDHYRMVQEKNK